MRCHFGRPLISSLVLNNMTRHPSVFAELVHEDRQALVAHLVIFDLLNHLPFFSQLRKTCTELGTDSGQLHVWPSRLQLAFLVLSLGSRHLLLLQLGVVAAAPRPGKHRERLHGRHSCHFSGTYSEARPDPFPDGFGAALPRQSPTSHRAERS